MQYGTDWNWFDLIVFVALVFGFIRGRKRGMSSELLPVLQVIANLVAGALLYKMGGEKFYDIIGGGLDMWTCYVFVYLGIVIVLHMLFSSIRKAVGEKLVSGDLFGSMEYYFGMVAGMARYLGITLMFLAVFNAKAIDYSAIKADRKLMQDNFGNISFPTFGIMQVDIFEISATGKFARAHLKDALIEPTFPSPASAHKETIGQKKQKALDDVMGGGGKK